MELVFFRSREVISVFRLPVGPRDHPPYSWPLRIIFGYGPIQDNLTPPDDNCPILHTIRILLTVGLRFSIPAYWAYTLWVIFWIRLIAAERGMGHNKISWKIWGFKISWVVLYLWSPLQLWQYWTTYNRSDAIPCCFQLKWKLPQETANMLSNRLAPYLVFNAEILICGNISLPLRATVFMLSSMERNLKLCW